MPVPLVRALGIIKKCAAMTNLALGKLDEQLARAIADAAQEVIDGKLNDAFPAGRLADGLGHADRI